MRLDRPLLLLEIGIGVGGDCLGEKVPNQTAKPV